MSRSFVLGFLAGYLLLATAAQASTVFTLDPEGGAITGAPGTTVGWGFSFTNDADYAVMTGSLLCDASSSSLPLGCLPLTPNLGTYTDFLGSQFIVVGPSPESPTVAQAFDNSLLTGMGSFTIDPSASGTANATMVLLYDLYSMSPNDPAFTPDSELSGGNLLTAPASITVQSSTAVPEPAMLPVAFAAILAGLLYRRRSRAEDSPHHHAG